MISARPARRNSPFRWRPRNRRVRFHHRLVNAGLRAQAQTEPIRAGQLHVAIIGAGATGTELAAELYQSAREMVAYGLDQVDPTGTSASF